MTTASTELCTYTIAHALELAVAGAARTVYVRAAPAAPRQPAPRRRWRWIAAALGLAGAILLLPGSRQPVAQSLACGDPRPRGVMVRWRAPAVASNVASYALVRGVAVSEGFPERIPIDPARVTAEGEDLVATVGLFDPALAWNVALVSVSPAGIDSVPSNSRVLSAQISGPCPPGTDPNAPPAPPTLIDLSAQVAAAAASLEQSASELRQQTEALHERIRREVESR